MQIVFTFECPGALVTITLDSAPILSLSVLNIDDLTDIVSYESGFNQSELRAYLADGVGSFRPPVISQVPSSVQFGAVGDLNGDGKTDLALTRTSSAFLSGSGPDQLFLALFGAGIRGVSSQANVTATVDGQMAEVLFAGPQGGFVGLDQLIILLPVITTGKLTWKSSWTESEPTSSASASGNRRTGKFPESVLMILRPEP